MGSRERIATAPQKERRHFFFHPFFFLIANFFGHYSDFACIDSLDPPNNPLIEPLLLFSFCIYRKLRHRVFSIWDLDPGDLVSEIMLLLPYCIANHSGLKEIAF